MLALTLVLLGAALLALALAERAVSRLPLTPAVIYLALGYAAGRLAGGIDSAWVLQHAGPLRVGVEFALLVSLFAIGLKLRFQPTLRAWRVALLLAGPGMVVTVALATAAGYALLALPWAAALLLAAVLAPTDPVLASEVQIRSDDDRDAVRLAITAEGGLNDATALPLVMLALTWLGLRAGGAAAWWWADLLWPLAGGAALGIGLGLALGHAVRRRLAAGDTLARDELLCVGAVAIGFGTAQALALSTFIVAFTLGAALLVPLRQQVVEPGQALAARLHDFGGRVERLVEGALVLALGALLSGIEVRAVELAFALLVMGVARPLAVWAVVRRAQLPPSQRRLVAWFGIRGVGSLYYLLLALELGVRGDTAAQLVRVTLLAVALSVLLHGVSATPLMTRYHRRRP